MGHDNLVLVAAAEAECYVERAGGDLENRLRAAMECTSAHWLVTDETSQFNAAVDIGQRFPVLIASPSTIS